MTSVALVAVLVSAALHASWNAMLKSTADPSASAALFVAGAAGLSGVLALALGGTLPAASWPGVIGSGLVEAVYFVTLSQALMRLPLGTAYGIARGGGQVVTWPVSALLFHEVIDARAATGAVLPQCCFITFSSLLVSRIIGALPFPPAFERAHASRTSPSTPV